MNNNTTRTITYDSVRDTWRRLMADVAALPPSKEMRYQFVPDGTFPRDECVIMSGLLFDVAFVPEKHRERLAQELSPLVLETLTMTPWRWEEFHTEASFNAMVEWAGRS